MRQLPPYRRQSLTEKFPHVHPSAIDLIEKMLTFDPRQRITGEGTSGSRRYSIPTDIYTFDYVSVLCKCMYAFGFISGVGIWTILHKKENRLCMLIVPIWCILHQYAFLFAYDMLL